MSTRKNEPVEMKVSKLGILRNLDFAENCIAEVALNQTDYSRILETLKKYVAQEFSDDETYNEALNTVCAKLKRKGHRLIMLEEIFVGTGKVRLDHTSEKEHTIEE